MGTQTEPSLADELGESFDEAENDHEAIEDDGAEHIEENALPLEPSEPELEALIAPTSWSKEYSETFAEIPRTHAEYILQREKEFSQGINEKGQELSGYKQKLESFDNSLAPLMQDWQKQGMDPQAGLNSLVGWQQALQADPQNTLMELAKHYQIDLQKAQEDAPYESPEVVEMRQQMSEMQQSLNGFTQHQTQQTQNAAFGQLDQFENAKDNDGNLLRPHFNEVIDDMTMLMKMGKVNDLDSAYQTAVNINPNLQAKMSEQAAEQKAHARTQQANKAKQAAKQSVSSRETNEVETDFDLRDDLGRIYDEAS